jgi:hypothetical protein
MIMLKTLSYFAILTLSSSVLISCSAKSNPSNSTPTADTSTVLSAFKLASDNDAPDYTSQAVESIWASATPFIVTASAIGDNFTGNSFPVTIKSVVSSQNIYFLVQYDDAEADYLEQPLKFKGGDPNTPANWVRDSSSHEDGVSMFFELLPGISGTKTFTADGCSMLCHSASTTNGTGMYSENGGRYDLWFWHAGKGNGCGLADDEMSIGDPVYAIQKDDDNAETFKNNVLSSPDFLPYLVPGGNNRNLDKHLFVAEETAVPFSTINPATGAAWAAGDKVPGSTVALPIGTNDYYDVKAMGFWANGKWTVKFQRKLNTGIYNLDTQFASGNQYLFSFAVHNNNAPGDHYGVANKSFKLKIP